MWIIKRIMIAALIAAAVFLASWNDVPQNPLMAGVVTGLSALLALVILFLDRIIRRLNSKRLLYGSLGVSIGLFTGYYLRMLLISFGTHVPGLEQAAYLLPALFFGFLGSRYLSGDSKSQTAGEYPEFEGKGSRAKLLDTSVIIDGRILDIAETHFIEGPFIIPNFVLREIQLISDSSDPIKRNRGRRGLEMLNKLQESKSLEVKISYLDYTDTREVDQKLVKASLETGAQLVTNDFNLNQIATLQGVEVLNLNNLTTALKPVVLPGEDIVIEIIKEGKDDNQGIGYLEDGTMVVVENGGHLQGKKVRVNVTSIIQTAAGKMVFTKSEGVVEEDEAENSDSRNRGRGRRGRSGRQGGRNSRNGDSDRGNRNRRSSRDRDNDEH